MKIGKIIVPVLCAGMVSLTAFADDNGAFEAHLVGSSVGQHVAGVPSGGMPWKVAQGNASVSTNGRIELEVKGLLIASGPSVDTVGPVTMVMASLVCGDVVAASTRAVALTTTGKAEIEDTIQVPSPCIAPAVLVRVAATTTGPVTNGPFIAVNALTGKSNGGGNDDHDNGR